jgi:hypothetical protein
MCLSFKSHNVSLSVNNPLKTFEDEKDMEQKTARLTVLIDPTKKDAFEQLCASQDVTPSQVVRQLIREYLEKHGITYINQTQNKNGTQN